MSKCTGCKHDVEFNVRILIDKCSECRRAFKDGEFRATHYEDLYEPREVEKND